ncbi:uncharacterized protein LOC130675183 [Microplitis mediator]|uniref:uncharacterized protein LOC130675183 n=1 Tax=Microplitis mediator TaxID=375433 RepID=UPI0025520FDB|nr:uncharacterized protein LOC130675183 [Microplitis mediator]
MSVMKILLISFCVIKAEVLLFPRMKRTGNCVEYRMHCNSSNETPCCQVNNVCAPISIDRGIYTFICLKPLHLGDFCEDDVDCLMLGYARCHESYCICLTNYGIPDKGTQCLPLLGGICLEDNDCPVENSICVDTECQCKYKYIAINNNQCKPSTLGKRCKGDLNCNSELHMTCSKNKICRCQSNHTVIDNTKCVPLLDEFCWSGEKCAPINSECFNNKCKCIKNYRALENYLCIYMVNRSSSD